MQLLPAIVMLCRGVPVETLEISSPSAADWCVSKVEDMHRLDALDAAQLGPLEAMQQLSSLAITGLDSLGPCLAGTLRHLTALTYLRLAIQANRFVPIGESVSSEAFDAVTALTQLVELHVSGSPCLVKTSGPARLQRLPDGMSVLTSLRRLHVHHVRFRQPSPVLTTLTGLKQLWMLDMPSQLPKRGPQPQNPLPPGMHVLRSLQELGVSCSCQPMPALALRALTKLFLDRPALGGKVCHVLSASMRASSCVQCSSGGNAVRLSAVPVAGVRVCVCPAWIPAPRYMLHFDL